MSGLFTLIAAVAISIAGYRIQLDGYHFYIVLLQLLANDLQRLGSRSIKMSAAVQHNNAHGLFLLSFPLKIPFSKITA